MNNENTAEQKLEMIANTTDLSIAIKRLERKKRLMEEDLKEHMHSILENLKPANILKQTLHEVQESTPLKHNLLKIALGTAIQFGITQFVAKADDNEKENIGFMPKKKNLLKRIFSI